MDDVNMPEAVTISEAKPKMLPKTAFCRHPAKQRLRRHNEAEAALLNELDQSLQRINAGMMRSNATLSKVVDELKLLRK